MVPKGPTSHREELGVCSKSGGNCGRFQGKDRTCREKRLEAGQPCGRLDHGEGITLPGSPFHL